MTVLRQIQKLLERYDGELRTRLELRIYKSLIQSYFTSNHYPRYSKQRRDLRYIEEALGI